MAISIICQQKDPNPWVEALLAKAPYTDLRVWPNDTPKEDITFVLSWKHPNGIFAEYPNLQGICSMGAGVDHLLTDPALPASIPLMRIVDDALEQSMWEHLLAVVFRYLRNLGHCQNDQLAKVWAPKPYRRIQDVCLGIMGLGQLGRAMAQRFAELGFAVNGWSNSAKAIPEVQSYIGIEQLPSFLRKSDLLICLLPLTPATHHILNAEHLRHCPRGTYLINVARGGVLNEADLLALIQQEHLSGACLDVFQQEPLPHTHPFWEESRILISPHVASITEPASVVGQVLENYRRVMHGEEVLNQVDLEKGY